MLHFSASCLTVAVQQWKRSMSTSALQRDKTFEIFHTADPLSSCSPPWFNLYRLFVPFFLCPPAQASSPSLVCHSRSCALRYFGIQSFSDYSLVCIFDKRTDDRRPWWNMKLVPWTHEQTRLWDMCVHTHTHTHTHTRTQNTWRSSDLGIHKQTFEISLPYN